MPASCRASSTRAAQMGWDVPIVGQTTLGSGQTKALLEKPEYWAKVYPEQFPPGLLRAGRQAAGSHQRLPRPAEKRQDRHGRHAAVVDRARLRRAADDRRGDEGRRHRAGADRRLLNKLKGCPGVYGDIYLHADQHNGYPDDEVVMVEANSLKDGAFNLAPGYSA